MLEGGGDVPATDDAGSTRGSRDWRWWLGSLAFGAATDIGWRLATRKATTAWGEVAGGTLSDYPAQILEGLVRSEIELGVLAESEVWLTAHIPTSDVRGAVQSLATLEQVYLLAAALTLADRRLEELAAEHGVGDLAPGDQEIRDYVRDPKTAGQPLPQVLERVRELHGGLEIQEISAGSVWATLRGRHGEQDPPVRDPLWQRIVVAVAGGIAKGVAAGVTAAALSNYAGMGTPLENQPADPGGGSNVTAPAAKQPDTFYFDGPGAFEGTQLSAWVRTPDGTTHVFRYL